ncbi:protein methyltranferase HemK [Baumannia cicadellinicola str. Hc (Homalodisca coagulata)]|uniref:Release factor glutamine methyltransferase n=1 Tax=Baumannia cicadellinicola subsp. Homalodisca coagulata TaxID=374463 RepID=Q1LTH6_BAUCH|nr:protein methyltranferase HemK [Baumannia cicadellinicola str. Hc (Homalodisca coagulata)]
MINWWQWLKHATSILTNSDSPRLDAELLLGQIVSTSRAHILAFGNNLLNDNQYKQLENLLERRLRGEPIAYIIGEWEFWSLPIRVSPDTIIPRPDTECLVEQALGLLLPIHAKVLDLGTGTGAITLALASERPSWQFTGVDNHPGAVELADINAARLGLNNVRFLCGSWFEPLQSQVTPRYSLIISNPPYVDANDPHLNNLGVCFEPKSALVADCNGIADLAAICCQASTYLQHKGWIILEHGWLQGKEVRTLLMKAGFIHIVTTHDYSNHERVTMGQWLS